MLINLENQVADLFVKPLHLGPFTYLVSKLRMLNIHSSLMGGVKLYLLFLFLLLGPLSFS